MTKTPRERLQGESTIARHTVLGASNSFRDAVSR